MFDTPSGTAADNDYVGNMVILLGQHVRRYADSTMVDGADILSSSIPIIDVDRIGDLVDKMITYA